MMRPEHEQVRRTTCLDKVRYASRFEAIERLRAMRRTAPRRDQNWYWSLRVQVCPFSCGDRHFHLAPTPSVIDLEKLARAMRDLPPCGVVVVDVYA